MIPSSAGSRIARRSVLISALFLLAAGLLWVGSPHSEAASPASRAPIADPQQQPIRVEVDLVSILASVVDKTNRPIIDLPKEAFQVYDEGKLQSLTLFEAETHQPIDLALMVDSSMSTALDFPVERDAAARFIQKVVRPGDGISFF